MTELSGLNDGFNESICELIKYEFMLAGGEQQPKIL